RDGNSVFREHRGPFQDERRGKIIANALGVMQFVRALRERIRNGEITCSVRLWQRPHVKIGGHYSLPPGQIVVTSLSEISLADVTPELARRSGFTGLVELLKIAKHGRGRRVFLVEFRYERPAARR
ncbi:MAG TPA: hypothetical protein VJ717_09585, partial [Gemmatimonadaceae bacterium]|nr:hypothetical protein [Gemmatimonadaceae bacterium]